MKYIALATGVAITCLASAGPAGAATLYASPTGTGTCALGDACSLDTALGGAGVGDDVALEAGTYTVSSTVEVTNGVHLHGIYGQGRPLVAGDNSVFGPTVSLEPGGWATYLAISAQGPGSSTIEVDGAVGRDLVLWGSGNAQSVATVKTNSSGTLLVDSLAWMDGPVGEAVHMKDSNAAPGGSAALVAVTAIGTGGSAAISTKAENGTQHVINTIACGSSDIATKDGTGSVQVDHSNFRPTRSSAVSDLGGNQSSLPVFHDEAAGDFRTVSGSPTIDAGVTDVRSGNDPWGVARTIPDIGALEHVPGGDPAGGGSSRACTDADSDAGGGDTGVPPTDSLPPATGDRPSLPALPPVPEPVRGAPPATLPPATPPVLGASVTLGEVKGTLLVRVPGTDRFVPLTADSTVPVGAVVDATRGTIELTSVRDASGKTQTGTFWGGVFQVRQSRRDSVTELALTGGDFSDCRAKRGGRRGKLVTSRTTRKRRLWGRDRGGRFRTRGRHGSATVRGTRWLTEDRCDGTLFKVTEGKIDVRDDRKRRTVRLKRGQSYLAAPAAKRRKR